MLAYGKNMPRNRQFSVFCPEKIKYYPEKNLPPPQNKILPSHPVPPKCRNKIHRRLCVEVYAIAIAFTIYTLNIH